MFGFLGAPCRSCAGDSAGDYRSLFCGVSGALRADYSPAARFLVNRDSTFLSLIGASLSTSNPIVSHVTCCNPLSKKRALMQSGLHARYAAAVTMCGLSIKLQDDTDDEKGLRRWASGLFGKALSPMRDRAITFLNGCGFPTEAVKESIQRQATVEKTQPDLLEASDPTGESYGQIFRHISQIESQPTEADELEMIGHDLGRLIYWQDAHEDLEKDKARGRFNPLSTQPLTELKSLFSEAALRLEDSIERLNQQRFAGISSDVLTNTWLRHGELLTDEAESELTERKKKRKKPDHTVRKKKSECCDCCPDCCPTPSCGTGSSGTGGCCDKLFDCGPGDTGCIDCGGCDCCSCG